MGLELNTEFVALNLEDHLTYKLDNGQIPLIMYICVD